ncbi:MAG: SPFH domain-containing protein [Planctomycetota bacterium]
MTDERAGDTPIEREEAGEMAPTARAASVVLQEGADAATDGQLLDPANQSLAEALRITFRLVQLAMVVLVGLFLLSGFQSVKESERGIKLLFGAVRSERTGLEPGFHFAFPFPIGELVKLEVANERLFVDRKFWPDEPRAGEAGSAAETLRSRRSLDPVESGSSITADLNIAHTQWQASFRITDVTSYAENVLPAERLDLVAKAVERGVVLALAETTIDELLQPTDPRAVLREARSGAQAVLDAAGAGIEIDTIELSEKAPPAFVKSNFDAVFSARSDAQKARSDAESERSRVLSQIAGRRSATLLVGESAYIEGERREGLIDRYETALALGDQGLADELLGQIDAVLLSDAVVIDGVELLPRTTGEVAQKISAARSDRRTIATTEEANRNVYLAKLDQYRANPTLMLTADWARSWEAFYSSPTTQIIRMPLGQRLELRINEDPRIAKAAEEAELRRRNEASLERREQAFQEGRFRQDTGVTQGE